MSLKRIALQLIAISVVALLASACGEAGTTGDPLLVNGFPIDPQFQEFYDRLGGYDTLGPAITPPFSNGSIHYQYTLNALLVFDPYAPGSQRFRLGGLGDETGIQEPPVPQPDDPSLRYVAGHIIAPEFKQLYEQMGGAKYVGSPLTEVHYNAKRKRYEQHFQNVGMFWFEFDEDKEAHLIAYGAWMCGESCNIPKNNSNTLDIPPTVDPLFVPAVARLGTDFTGFPLKPAYQTPDGYSEQVFENLVLVSDPGQPGHVVLREAALLVGHTREALVGPSTDPLDYFYELDGDSHTGHNIPVYFQDYMAEHGGLEIAGIPINEKSLTDRETFRQCFTNICLEAKVGQGGSMQVMPVALGVDYEQLPLRPFAQDATAQAAPPQPKVQPTSPPAPLSTPEPLVQPTALPNPAESQQNTPHDTSGIQISVQVWERYPMVNPSQPQEVGVSILQNNQPLTNIEPDLVITLPNGRSKVYYMYPTDARGQTIQMVDPLDVPSGTVIPYEVCIYQFFEGKFCVRDTYLVWQSP